MRVISASLRTCGSRRHHQLPRRSDGGKGLAPKGDELRSGKEVFCLFDVVAQERAVRGRPRSDHGHADPAGAGKATMSRSGNWAVQASRLVRDRV